MLWSHASNINHDGMNNIRWNSSGKLSNGIYFAQLQQGNNQALKRFIILK
jgi:hypothetical protein